VRGLPGPLRYRRWQGTKKKAKKVRVYVYQTGDLMFRAYTGPDSHAGGVSVCVDHRLKRIALAMARAAAVAGGYEVEDE